MRSVDSSTKLWDITKTTCIMNNEGHIHHSSFVEMDSFDHLFCLGGEDSTVRVYNKKSPIYIASAKLSNQSTYVSGCSWLCSKCNEKEKILVAVDNTGYAKYFSIQDLVS